MTQYHKNARGEYARCRAGQKKGGIPRGCPYGTHTDRVKAGESFYRSDRGVKVVKKDLKGRPEKPIYRVKDEDLLNPAAYHVPDDLRPHLETFLKSGEEKPGYSFGDLDQEGANRLTALLQEQAGIEKLVALPLKVNKGFERKIANRCKKYGVTEEQVLEAARLRYSQNAVLATAHDSRLLTLAMDNPHGWLKDEGFLEARYLFDEGYRKERDATAPQLARAKKGRETHDALLYYHQEELFKRYRDAKK